MRLTVRTATADDAAAWDNYVLAAPKATFFHRFGWRRVIDEALRQPCHFLLAEREGRIEGVLPLGEIKSALFGHTLISMPFSVYGGIVADSEEATRALDQAAQALAEKLGVGHLEYRDRDAPAHPEWPGTDLYATFRKVLDPEVEKNLTAIPRKQRAMVRKGIKAGLKSEIDHDIRRFYPAFCESWHRLGTPVLPKRYFQLVFEVFGSAVDIVTVTQDDHVICCVMNFYFRDEVWPYYAGITTEARALAGSDFMYWEVMRLAVEQGYRLFDFGRSKAGTGSWDFKHNWGFEPQPLHYGYHLVRASAVPQNNPNNPKYRLFIKAWQRLPLPLANFIGPHIIRNLG
jgi:FemAB-related protein (PEP-CTERM system-associated)